MAHGLIPQRNTKSFTRWDSGLECHLAPAATGRAPRDAKRDGPPAPRPPSSPPRPARCGCGHPGGGSCERSRAPRPRKGRGHRRGRGSYAGSSRASHVSASGATALVVEVQTRPLVRECPCLPAGHGSHRRSAPPAFRARRRRRRDVLRAPRGPGEAGEFPPTTGPCAQAREAVWPRPDVE